MDILLNVETFGSPNQVVACKLHDKIESNERGLTALFLSSVLIQKITQELRLVVSRRVTWEWMLPVLMEILGEDLEARERTAVPRGDDRVFNKTHSKPTSATLFTGQRAHETSFCCYCRGNHGADLCKSVTSTNNREKFGKMLCLSQKGTFQQKLQVQHMWRQKSLYDFNQSTPTNTPPKSPATATPNMANSSTPVNLVASPFVAPTTCCNTHADQSVLFQTARTLVFNPEQPYMDLKVTIIFDSASHKSYLAESSRQKLQLQRKGRKTLSILTFSSKESYSHQSDLVEIGIRTRSDGVTLLTTPVICEPMTRPPKQEWLQN